MQSIEPAIIWMGVAGVVALALLVAGMYQERRWRLIRDLPTSKTRGVFIGLVEVAGTVRSDNPLVSVLAEQPCVWYRWSIEEHWSRTVTETTTDSKGRTTTRTRRESGWKTVDSGGEQVAFEIIDDTGSLRIVPDGAEVSGDQSLAVTCDEDHPLYYGKGPREAVANSDHRRRFSEEAVVPGASCYVIGQARERHDRAAAEIAFDRHAPLFQISVHGEGSVASGYFWVALLLELLGLIIAVVAPVVLVGQPPQSESQILAGVVGAGAYLMMWMLGWIWQVFNSLVELRQRVRQGWANIEVQLKRRFDLLQQILPVVQAMAQHEARVHEVLAALRSQAHATPPGSPGPDVTALAPRLQVLAEAYPHLRAVEGFDALHRTLVDCEDRIALARAYFNDIATHWNTRLERFPDLVVAWLAAGRRQALMAEIA
jgi:hypothetical protein